MGTAGSKPLLPLVVALPSMAGGGGVVGGLAKLRDLLSWVRSKRRRGRRRRKSKGRSRRHGQEEQCQESASRVHMSLLPEPSPLLQPPPLKRWRSCSSLGEATIWAPTTELTGNKERDSDPSSSTVWGSIISIASLSVRTGV